MRNLVITQQITNRVGKSIEAYLREVAAEPMVTVDEEISLAERIKQGDDIALEKLVKANLRFVISVAKQYQHAGLDLEDLINEGNLGLIKAAQRFDETKGFKFISYAVWWIRQSIIDAISKKGRSIRLPVNRSAAGRKIIEAAIRIEQEHERTASPEEISELVEMTSDEVRDILESLQKQGSIDAPLKEGEDSSKMSDVMPDKSVDAPTEDLMKESLCKEIEHALEAIDEKEAEVIRLSFGLNGVYPMTLEDISNEMGISMERVRQIKNRGLANLRRSSKATLLKTYL